MTGTVFVDAGVLIGAAAPPDAHHSAAGGILTGALSRRWRRVHTSDYVIAEALNFVRARFRDPRPTQRVLEICFGAANHRAAIDVIDKVHYGRWRRALALYRRVADRRLSFTDCTTLVLMEELGIGALATFDSGFGGLVNVVDRA